MNKITTIIIAIITIAAILITTNPVNAQGKNPFPPKAGTTTTTKTTFSQQCSGTTKKGEQCKRMVHITKEQQDKPAPVYCFSHKQ